MNLDRLNAMLSAIDLINNEDPNQITFDNRSHPKEYIYGQQMTTMLDKHWPQANELLQIAVRAQHIKRWHLKRTEFDLGKKGYFKWRIALGKYHAELTEKLMQTHQYTSDESLTTAAIIRKEKLKSNNDSQTLEDVACLVFLQFYFDDFSRKHNEEKVIRVLQKTWGKMSEQGHDIALALDLPEHLSTLVAKALA
ncbi:MAG: DUF4202 domain-containing protein [Colwellia sp.]|nr:DUF4202 domain-containing protein [Colwellia sp.]